MTGTFHTSFGKVRVASNRRYVVLIHRQAPTKDGQTAATVRRSDNLVTANTIARTFNHAIVLDTATGQEV